MRKIKLLAAPLLVTVGLCILVTLTTFGCVGSYQQDPWEDWGLQEPEYTILELPGPLVTPVCIASGTAPPDPGHTILACAPLGPVKECTIIINGDMPYRFYLAVMRHEKAHCRGWDHGDPFPEGELG